MALLVLDATPIEAFVAQLMKGHERLPDVEGTVRLPENVTVVQYAESSNGHAALREPLRREAVLADLASERERFPVSAPEREAAICFKSQRDRVEQLGFAPEQVLTFGRARGSNPLAQAERLHIVGRPMPPGEELVYLAKVLHHDEHVVSPRLVVERRSYGGQPYASPVVDFADTRVSALLHGAREDEMVQVIHRARLSLLQEQSPLGGHAEDERASVRLVLHTSHPVPGLRVDDLRLNSIRQDLNEQRRAEAETRILNAAAELQRTGQSLSARAVARRAGSHPKTVAAVLGTVMHTPREDLLYRV